MSKPGTKPKPHLRSMYYEYLGRIFWKSDNHLFHALACLKNLIFVKGAKHNLSPEELQLLASKAVLATLCVPFQKNSDIHTTLELTTEGSNSPYEKAKKHATLFNVQSVPTRDSISTQLVEKGLLPLALEPCKRLFALIESDFTPLSLCQDAKPFLDAINQEDVFDGAGNKIDVKAQAALSEKDKKKKNQGPREKNQGQQEKEGSHRGGGLGAALARRPPAALLLRPRPRGPPRAGTR